MDELRIVVRETLESIKGIRAEKGFLKSEWCMCADGGEFFCYPEDGVCSCGIYKHHVHCKKCGGVMQIG